MDNNIEQAMIQRQDGGLFARGTAPGPGRPKGIVGGRTRALQILDDVSNRTDNADLLAAAMDQAMKKNPLQFFLKYMAPLMPKESLHKIATETPVVRWASLKESIEQDREFRRDLQAIRAEYPGQDSKILDLICRGCPIGAIRCQMNNGNRLPTVLDVDDD